MSDLDLTKAIDAAYRALDLDITFKESLYRNEAAERVTRKVAPVIEAQARKAERERIAADIEHYAAKYTDRDEYDYHTGLRYAALIARGGGP